MTGRQRKSTPWDAILRAFGKRKRRPRKDGHPLPEPVEPDPRKPRSGGAEAELEFDD